MMNADRSKVVPERGTAPLSLALQGGGSFGAFTWGVLDRLLAGEARDLDTISGASAGAVNAVLVAEGLRRDGPAGARERLTAFWTAVSGGANSFGAGSNGAFAMSARFLSPYVANPFDLNPLRFLLDQLVDFDALRAAAPVRLLIGATRVSDGASRLFRETEITRDAVLASACLPHLSHAVEIDGDHYWDGGYSANPPLLPLIEIADAPDILLVEIVPTGGEDHPRSSPAITKRVGQITFAAPLRRDLATLDAMRRLAPGGTDPLAAKIGALALHRIGTEAVLPNLARESPLDLRRRFVESLRDAGYEAADRWSKTAGPTLEPTL